MSRAVLASASLVIGGVAALVASAVLVGWRLTHPVASFGWFAYAPLSDEVFSPATTDPVTAWAVALAGVGIAALAFAAGLAVGRRSVARAAERSAEG